MTFNGRIGNVAEPILCIGCSKVCSPDEFYYHKAGKNVGKRNGSRCRACRTTQKAEWRAKNRGRYNDYHRFRKYGITREEYDALMRSQAGRCAICRTTEPGGKGNTFVVDHDHKCCAGSFSCGGCIRGLLCTKCNTALGLFDDRVEIMRKAIQYVAR